MKTKLLRKLRREYFNLYVIRYSDEKERWEVYIRDIDCFDNYYEQCVLSTKELSDAQNYLRRQVQGHILKYLQKKEEILCIQINIYGNLLKLKNYV